jgi:hypothetical protein
MLDLIVSNSLLIGRWSLLARACLWRLDKAILLSWELRVGSAVHSSVSSSSGRLGLLLSALWCVAGLILDVVVGDMMVAAVFRIIVMQLDVCGLRICEDDVPKTKIIRRYALLRWGDMFSPGVQKSGKDAEAAQSDVDD